MEILLNIFIFLITIFILVLVHEYGHFCVARCLKIKVERFSIGFGRPIWKWCSKKDIEYVIAPILLGGYVKLNDDSFQAQKVWRRLFVMIAGVTANIILAGLLFWTVFIIGIQVPKAVIGKVVANSIAAQAGVQAGEEIKSIDNSKVADWQDVTIAIIKRLGDKGYLFLNQHKLDLFTWSVNELNPDPLTSLGIQPYVPPAPPIIKIVKPDSPAAKMGLQAQDQILAINNTKFSSWHGLIRYIQHRPQQRIVILVKRAETKVQLTGVVGKKIQLLKPSIGYLGIAFASVKWPAGMLQNKQFSLVKAWVVAWKTVWLFFSFNFIILFKLIIGKVSLRVLGGPLTIFAAADVAFKQGLLVYLSFLALISIMLAFVNILPIPVLDGGYVVFLLFEALTGKAISEKWQEFAMRVGLILLAIIAFVAIGNDLMRMFF